ncbi:MAG TPA: ABC transporter permease [Acidimicrobiia bacterium]|nr:ABC transporter permease [Acidimicrobiia bacterium]
MTPYIISGLVVGSIYAISALGLVLTYTSSRVFNFAHGALAYGIAVFYYYLTRQNGWSISIAAPFTILIVAPLIGLLLYFALFKRLTHATPTVRLVSTVGLWVAIPALTRILFPFASDEIFNPEGLVSSPATPDFIKVFGTYVNENQFVVIVSAVVIAAVATLVLRYTSLGLATRMTVDHPRNAGIAGVNTEAVTAGSWMVGVMLAGFAGVLLAPILSLNDSQFTFLLVGSFAAVVIARMTSLPLAFAGAIAVGLLQQLWVKVQPESGFFSAGVSASIPFVVMLVFLIAYSFSAKGLRTEAFEVDRRGGRGTHGDAPPLPPARGWKRAIGPLIMAVVLVALPLLFDNVTLFGITFDQFWVGVFAQGIALAIIYLSYILVTGEGGMISLCQITLAGIGAFAAARLAAEAGWPVWLAILAGAVFAVPFGLLVALPSLRIGDLYLALLTIGFALLVEQFVWTRNEYENFGAGVQIARPFGISITDRLEMYAIVAVVFAVAAFAIVNLKRATSGLVFAAIRSSEPAATTSGMSVVRVKLVLFGVSAFVAGLGGGLYATVVGTALPKSFNALVGIVWLAIVVTWGVRSVIGAVLAGMIFAIAPQRLSIILVLVFFLVVSGVITRLALGRAYRNVLGVLAMTVLAVVAVAGSAWIWENVSSEDSVKVILVALGLGAALLVGTRVAKAPIANDAVRIGLLLVVAAMGIGLALVLGGLELGEVGTREVPTMLFGLGAIGLVNEPRGVVYDIINRQRLTQYKAAEHRDEDRQLADDAALAGAPA